jgi:FkbM family methyltransferase
MIIGRALAKLGRMSLVDSRELHELQEATHLRRLFELLGVDLVIDVGANAGQYAQRLRRHVRYRGVIVSVEPQPEMLEHLNAASRGDPHWFIEPIAVSDRRGTVSFNVMSDAQCSSLAQPDNSETALFSAQTTVKRQITVESRTLDDIVDHWIDSGRFKRPFLKLDTQGHDVAIVTACRKLRAFVAFQSELSVKRLYKGAPHFTEAITEYCSLGFDVSALVPNNASGFPQLIEIDCIMIRSDLAKCQRHSLD